MIKVTPMLFSGDLVRALLTGNKTQTRRIFKEPKGSVLEEISAPWLRPTVWFPEKEKSVLLDCPFGMTGDLIYVRETFQGPLVDFEESEACAENMHLFENPNYCKYRATDPIPEFSDLNGETHYGWKPSIHMPRWASRLTLKITDVRVERIQDISKEDAKAEGVKSKRPDNNPVYLDYLNSSKSRTEWFMNPTYSFKSLWKSIYGPSWDKNEWVWVIDFEVIHKNVDLALN